MRLDDEILVSRCLSGDQAAFTFLVNKYKEMICAYAYHKVGNHQEAEDIAQEVFIKAYRKLGQLKSPHKFQSWLYTIVSNECKMWFRKHSKECEKSIHLEDVSADEFTELAMRTHSDEEVKLTVKNAMKTLPADNQLVLSLYYMSDLSVREIASFMGISSNTVKGKLHRARKQLGERLGKMVRKQLKTEKLKSGFIFTVMDSIKNLPIPPLPKPKWNGDGGVKWAPIPITVALVLVGIIGFGLSFGGGISSDTPTFEPIKEPPVPSLEVSLLSGFDERGVLSLKGDSENKVTALQNTGENKAFSPQNIDVLQQFTDEKIEDLPKSSTGNSISGTVYHADGVTPFEGAFVYLRRYVYDGGSLSDLFWPIRTDVNGRYRFDNLPVAPYNWLAIYTVYPDYEMVRKEPVELHLNEALQEDFVLARAASISGKVIGVENVKNLYLRLETKVERFPYRRAFAYCAVGPDGSYCFTITASEFESYGINGVKQARQRSEIYWPKGAIDYADVMVVARVKGYEAVRIPNVRITRGQNTPNIHIRPAERTGSIAGRVIDDNGQPMAEVRLYLRDIQVEQDAPNLFLSEGISEANVGMTEKWVTGKTHIVVSTSERGGSIKTYYDLIETKSRADGSFLFDDAPEGIYKIGLIGIPDKVSKIGPLEWQKWRGGILVERGAALHDVKVRVTPRQSFYVTGRIFIGDKRTPLANTKLRMKFSSYNKDGLVGRHEGTICTNEEGCYKLKEYSTGKIKISLTFIKGNLKATHEFKAKPGERIENLDFVLKMGRN